MDQRRRERRWAPGMRWPFFRACLMAAFSDWVEVFTVSRWARMAVSARRRQGRDGGEGHRARPADQRRAPQPTSVGRATLSSPDPERCRLARNSASRSSLASQPLRWRRWANLAVLHHHQVDVEVATHLGLCAALVVGGVGLDADLAGGSCHRLDEQAQRALGEWIKG